MKLSFFTCELADLREQTPGEFKFPDADAFDGGSLVSFHPSNVGQSRDLPDEDVGDMIQIRSMCRNVICHGWQCAGA